MCCSNYFDIDDYLWGLSDWWAKKRSAEWSNKTLLLSPGPFLSVAAYVAAVLVLHLSTYPAYGFVIIINAVAFAIKYKPTVARMLMTALLACGVSKYGHWMRKLAVAAKAVKVAAGSSSAPSAPAWDKGITWQRMRVMHEDEDTRSWFSMYWQKNASSECSRPCVLE